MFIFLIKEIREERGVTQKELAELTGISQNYLSCIENNKKRNVNFEIILRISKALNIGIERIYITTSDIPELKEEMYRRIDKYGINSEETLKVSKIIDKLVVLKMENNRMS